MGSFCFGLKTDCSSGCVTTLPGRTSLLTKSTTPTTTTTMTSDFNNVPKYARSSKRVTITIPFHVFNSIVNRSQEEGRSTSNLMAYLLERAIEGKF